MCWTDKLTDKFEYCVNMCCWQPGVKKVAGNGDAWLRWPLLLFLQTADTFQLAMHTRGVSDMLWHSFVNSQLRLKRTNQINCYQFRNDALFWKKEKRGKKNLLSPVRKDRTLWLQVLLVDLIVCCDILKRRWIFRRFCCRCEREEGDEEEYLSIGENQSTIKTILSLKH